MVFEMSNKAFFGKNMTEFMEQSKEEKAKMNIPIISEGIKAVTGFTDSIFGGLDELITSDEERGNVKALIMEKSNTLKLSLEQEHTKLQQEATKRHEIDTNSDNVIAKYIRPVTTGVLILVILYMVLFDPKNPNIMAMLGLGGIAIGFYFPSRGIEKVKKIAAGMIGRK